LSRLWQRVGLMLHHVVNPIVMGVLFYLVVTPFGFVTRRLGKGLQIERSRNEGAPTYWRDRSEPRSIDMRNQF